MTKLVWLDVETTGLDPAKESILELGIVITDQHLTVLAEKAWVLPLEHFEARLDKLHETVFNMHVRNGLLKEVRDARPVDVEKEALAFLRAHDCNFIPLCGSSVHFDRGFLKAHLPRLEKVFTHRHLDVSSLLIAWDIFGREKPAKGVTAHRAIADCKESISTLKALRDGL